MEASCPSSTTMSEEQDVEFLFESGVDSTEREA